MGKFRDWMMSNSVYPDKVLDIDIESEFGKDLSFREAVDTAIQKFPSLWKPKSAQIGNGKPKQIIFIKELIDGIYEGKVQVTYRKSPKVGLYYIIQNRFRQKSDSTQLLIEFYRTDRVNAYSLTDEEAQLAGVGDANQIRTLF